MKHTRTWRRWWYNLPRNRIALSLQHFNLYRFVGRLHLVDTRTRTCAIQLMPCTDVVEGLTELEGDRGPSAESLAEVEHEWRKRVWLCQRKCLSTRSRWAAVQGPTHCITDKKSQPSFSSFGDLQAWKLELSQVLLAFWQPSYRLSNYIRDSRPPTNQILLVGVITRRGETKIPLRAFFFHALYCRRGSIIVVYLCSMQSCGRLRLLWLVPCWRQVLQNSVTGLVCWQVATLTSLFGPANQKQLQFAIVSLCASSLTN